jgi:DNA-binding NtrC family response regulator
MRDQQEVAREVVDAGTGIARRLSVSNTAQPHVMVVDDDPVMCEFLHAFLAERGCNAVTFGTAEEAVARYGDDRPAAVILDLMMPGRMDGLEALAEFKKIDRDVPVIVLSGQGRTNIVVQAMKLGAADFVSKPFDDIDLEVPLANALKERQHAPAAMAVAAAEAGNYSLKDISRAAAREAERELILKTLQQTRWNRKQTAEILGISYKALLYKIKENGLGKAS